MKMFALAIILMSFPWLSNASGWRHSNHDDHHQRHDTLSFWENVERRQHKQHKRIHRGIDNGQLTRREVRKLKRERKHVAREIRHYKRHHYVASSSKRRIMEHLDHVSRKIHDLKHNNHHVRRHSHHDRHQTYIQHDKQLDYRNKRHLSWGNNDHSAGVYFRF